MPVMNVCLALSLTFCMALPVSVVCLVCLCLFLANALLLSLSASVSVSVSLSLSWSVLHYVCMGSGALTGWLIGFLQIFLPYYLFNACLFLRLVSSVSLCLPGS